jgi:ParB family transcriptional regulator, chromosome partitioning protein
MAKVKGLGRGLDALLGADAESEVGERLQQVALNQLRPGKYQPRSHMDPDAISQLAESIKAQGVIQPILARTVGDGTFEIIAGERRWRAASIAGLESVPVVIREVRDEAALAMALIENIQREDLNPIEEATGIRRLIDEFGMTHESAADAIGRSRSAVTNLLRLLGLPAAVKQMLIEGKLEMGHARALLTLPGSRQIELANEIGARQLSVRQAERMASRVHNAAEATHPAHARDRDISALEEELSERLGTRVSILPGSKGAGRVVINYGDLDHLDQLLTKLRA